MGSFVNDVFLINVDGEKFVAKRYTNWISLKWVTLSLYGLGSVRFSISGRPRMEAEYVFNDLLTTRSLRVKVTISADTKSRTILLSFFPGARISTVPVHL